MPNDELDSVFGTEASIGADSDTWTVMSCRS